MASMRPTPLTSPSSDSLLLSPSSISATTRYSTDLSRSRSRARPIHLVRQALGYPHFGISRAVVAPVNKDPKRRPTVPQQGSGREIDGRAAGKGGLVRKGKEVRPILSRLPLPSRQSTAAAAVTVTIVHVQESSDSEDEQGQESLLVPSSSTVVPNHPTTSDVPQWNASFVESSSPAAAVLYTHARLPYLSEQDTYLWTALHHLRPVRDDYGRAFKEVAEQVKRNMDSLHVHPGFPKNPLPQARDTVVPSSSSTTTTCPVGFAKHAAAYVSLIQHAFNWSALPPLPAHTDGKYYGVLFRSTRHTQYLPSSSSGFTTTTTTTTSTDRDPSSALYAADRQAHEEAVESGGLLMYWYGEPDSQGNNVATCVWTGRDAARRASRLEKHRVAAALAGEVYATYELVRYCVRKVQGETGVRIEVWED
ncbi:hypothetical protein QFC19_008921 [Naganishia cerealis]|uniref:Uncharacterized protein n=1 Tax=Naganishia cerealis TaxID=610337 RepID=A0ACC2UYF3_9TREE|nr:hypothetical protein QFC19_008921 [Naganishia cerealis]